MSLELGRAGRLELGLDAVWTTTVRLLAGVIPVATTPKPVSLRTAFDCGELSSRNVTPLPLRSDKDKAFVAHHLCFLYKVLRA
jgi:hypothetical protein